MTSPFYTQTVLFQTIQFNPSTLFSCIWPIVRILLCATIRARVDLGAMAMKGYSAFPKAPALLELYDQMQFCIIYRTLVGWGVLLPLQRCSRCILLAPAYWAGRYLSSPNQLQSGRMWQKIDLMQGPYRKWVLRVAGANSHSSGEASLHVYRYLFSLVLLGTRPQECVWFSFMPYQLLLVI